MFKKSWGMGTNVLGQFLRSICDNSDWKYAVFWKRKYHQNQTMLILEDGYCDDLKQKKMFGNDQVIHPQKQYSPGCGISGLTSVGLALFEMASVHYAMGEGLVGKVAYSGIHCWTSSKDILAFENSLLTPKLPTEWLPQIEAGIETIVLVAVAPHGVLQLGSLEVLAEEMGLYNHIIGEFNAIQNHFPTFSSSNSNSVAQSTSSFGSILLENSDVSAIGPATFLSDMHSEEIDEIAELPTPFSLSMEITFPEFSVEDIFLESGDPFLNCLRDLHGEDTDMPFSSLSDIKEEDMEIYPWHNNSGVGIYDDQPAGIVSSHFFENILENFFETYDAGADEFGVSTTYELGEAQSILQQHSLDDIWNTFMPNNDTFTGNAEISVQAANELFRKISDAEELFGAAVANSCEELDKVLNNLTDSSELMPQVAIEPVSAFSLDYTESDSLWSQITSVDASGSRGSSSKFSPTTTIETMMNQLIHSHFQNEGYADKKSAGGSKPVLRKTRDKAIDKLKRRPRDRQLIQDRLKVLRDLVPNGEKFSIDGLLERTIKHMMFLRKVSDQSRKLRAYLEVDGDIKLKSSQRKDTSKSGASWAYQVGSEQDVFPIVVEDLDIPGHMLIEMLCNDRDLFLEVAQVICGLDLTIVKGGMKTRSSSSWAQFVVEVHKGFQRMDVFWPLMQLLQRNPNLISR